MLRVKLFYSSCFRNCFFSVLTKNHLLKILSLQKPAVSGSSNSAKVCLLLIWETNSYETKVNLRGCDTYCQQNAKPLENDVVHGKLEAGQLLCL